jgi:hypothetical protein
MSKRNSSQSTLINAPLVTAAALDSSAFNRIAANDTIPVNWDERAKKAWEYYTEEPLVKNCLNSWRTFAVGDEIKITSDDADFNETISEASTRLKISDFVKDMILQLLVKGDAVGFKVYAKNKSDIEELVCVNPVTVKVKYAQGMLVDATQQPEEAGGLGDALPLPIDQLLHLKWDSPAFSPRGNSMVLPAFQSIELLRDYRRAEQAIAKRWTTPLRLIKVGGAYNQKMVMPDQRMLEQVRDMVNKMDLRSGLIVPFYITVETHGTDGQVLKVEEKVREVKEDIVVALGLSRSLVAGDGPNFATASVSMQKMIIMIREIKQAAKKILTWVFNDWQEINGYTDKTLQYIFNDLDPSDAVDFKKLLIELYDRKLISRSSLQLKMDLIPEIESANQENEDQNIYLLDEKQIKPIVDMVIAGILSVDLAKKILHIMEEQPSADNTGVPTETLPETLAALSSSGTQAHTCDDCNHFNDSTSYCRVHSCERNFASAACRFLDLKVVA